MTMELIHKEVDKANKQWERALVHILKKTFGRKWKELKELILSDSVFDVSTFGTAAVISDALDCHMLVFGAKSEEELWPHFQKMTFPEIDLLHLIIDVYRLTKSDLFYDLYLDMAVLVGEDFHSFESDEKLRGLFVAHVMRLRYAYRHQKEPGTEYLERCLGL